MELKSAVTTGVLVEFVEPSGLVVGQVVYSPWRGQPLPEVGERLVCSLPDGRGQRARKLQGFVVERAFEVQQDGQGRPAVWARIEVRVAAGRTQATLDSGRKLADPWFSAN